VRETGGVPFLHGISSGAALALEAVQRGLPVQKLALYEAPFVVDGTRASIPDDYLRRLRRAVAENRLGDAVAIFMREGVQVPAIGVFMIRLMPAYRKLKAIAHTVISDAQILGDTGRGRPLPKDRWSNVKVPTLVGVGTKSPPWMRNGMTQLSQVRPNASQTELQRQKPMLKPERIAPVLCAFFV
jgi:hypothetical protein